MRFYNKYPPVKLKKMGKIFKKLSAQFSNKLENQLNLENLEGISFEKQEARLLELESLVVSALMYVNYYRNEYEERVKHLREAKILDEKFDEEFGP
jgi:hypothetical protein